MGCLHGDKSLIVRLVCLLQEGRYLVGKGEGECERERVQEEKKIVLVLSIALG